MSGRIFEFRDLAADADVTADVCVIGSGCGGATVAHRLAERGVDVVVLEQGGYYPTGSFDQDELNMNAKLSAERSLKTSADGGTSLLYGHNVGGASVHYWADSFRTPADRLALWAQRYGITGHDVATLTPAWDELTQTLSVHDAPDEYFNRMNQLVRQAATTLRWRGDRVPAARRDCQKSGHCMQGCLYEAKRSQLVTHLRTAVGNGARIYADVRARHLDFAAGRVQSLRAQIIDRARAAPSGATLTVRARAFVVAAGGYNSAAFLLRNGLARQLPALGKGFAFNPSPMVHALYDEDIVLWRNIPAAWGIDEFRLARYDARGHYTEGGYLLMPNQIQPAMLAATLPLFGDAHGEWMRQLARIGSTIGWIDDHPDELGEIRVDSKGAARVHYPFGPITTAMLRDLVRKQLQLQFAAGAKRAIVSGSQALSFRPGDSLDAVDRLAVTAAGLHMGAPHPSGGCAMGPSSTTAVVDSSHRVHGFRNLFVADSSVFPTAVSVDPSFTIMAFSYVAARQVAAELGGGASAVQTDGAGPAPA